MSAVVRVLLALMIAVFASAVQAQNKVPPARELEALVKGALLTLNDANTTGIYTVFHAKLAKPVRREYSPERLQQEFKGFVEKHIDFDIIAALKPSYTSPSRVDKDGRLLVKGHFLVEPSVRLKFDLTFIPSEGDWRLVDINVETDTP